jgi:hypothetical protein
MIDQFTSTGPMPSHRRSIRRILGASIFTAFSALAISAHASATIDQAITDMQSSSQAVPSSNYGSSTYNWYYNPGITQFGPFGSTPYLASWWSGNRPTTTSSILSWFVVMEGQGNTATNTRVEIANLRVYILQNSTRKWLPVDVESVPAGIGRWSMPGFTSQGTEYDVHNESDGGVSVKPQAPYFQHGWGKTVTLGTGSLPAAGDPSTGGEVRAAIVAMDYRLVVDNPNLADDRANAVYTLDVGADYYPTNAESSNGWGVGYAPGMGNGRMLKPTNDWQTATLLVPNWVAMNAPQNSWSTVKPEFDSNPPTAALNSNSSGGAGSGITVPTSATHIKGTQSQRCMDVVGGSSDNGAGINLYDCHSDYANQQWALKNVGNSQYQLSVASSGKCLDVPAYSHSNQTALQQYDCNSNSGNNQNQLWTIKPVVGTGNFQLVSVNTPPSLTSPGMCVDVKAYGTANGTVIQQYECNSDPNTNQNQLWYFTP